MWVVVDEVGVHLLSVQIHVDSCLQRHAQGLAKGRAYGLFAVFVVAPSDLTLLLEAPCAEERLDPLAVPGPVKYI